MSKEQPWLNFAKISQDAEGNWVLNVLGRELFVRAYGGTRAGDTDEGTIEAEFVFPQGEKLLTAHVLKGENVLKADAARKVKANEKA